MSKVLLVSSTKGVGKYKNLDNEELIAAIARHGVIKKDNGRLVKFLMDKSHWSPLEQVNFGFEIETSRAIGRHILRHQLHVQEHSQRYSDRVKFEPIELRKEHPTNRQSSVEVFNPLVTKSDVFGQEDLYASEMVSYVLDIIESSYKALIEVGVAKECARMILPECTTTTMTFNGTLRNWLTFLNVRVHEDAQKEIRVIATLIGEALEKELPNIFSVIDWRNGMFL